MKNNQLWEIAQLCNTNLTTAGAWYAGAVACDDGLTTGANPYGKLRETSGGRNITFSRDCYRAWELGYSYEFQVRNLVKRSGIMKRGPKCSV